MTRVNVKSTDILDPMFRETPTVSNTFLPRDPTKALDEVKEELYDRLKVLRACLGPDAPFDSVDRQMLNEIDFLSGILDKIERSL